MSSYAHHQNLIKKFKLEFPKYIPRLRVFDRHVGLFNNRRGEPIKINKPGMADLYGLIDMDHFQIHIEIEAKTGTGRKTPNQKRWEDFITLYHGRYFLMRDHMETIGDIENYIDYCLRIVYNQ